MFGDRESPPLFRMNWSVCYLGLGDEVFFRFLSNGTTRDPRHQIMIDLLQRLGSPLWFILGNLP